MALVKPTAIALSRTWELISTPISSTIDSDVAEWGLANILGTIYIITSGVVLMTLKVQESPDNVNWVTIDEEEITENMAYRIQQPFPYLRIQVSSYTSGQIDSIYILGIIQ